MQNTLPEYMDPDKLLNASDIIVNSGGKLGCFHFDKGKISVYYPERFNANSTYVFCYANQIIRYSAQESSKGKSGFVKVLLKVAENVLVVTLNRFRFNDVVQVNNQALSTNLLGELQAKDLWEICINLMSKNKNKVISIRGLNNLEHKSVIKDLEGFGMLKVVSRKIFAVKPTPELFKKKRPLQQDKKRWEKQTELYWKAINGANYTQEILGLYAPLYLEKHSGLNPNYTFKFVESIGLNNKYCYFEGLFDSKDKLRGFHLLVNNGKTLTAPMIGYDMQAPKDWGLYRNLNLRLTEVAQKKGLLLNMSSGAEKFKTQRGGEPYFEYHLLYVGGASKWRRLPWKVLSKISKKYVEPAMENMEL